MNFDAHLVGDGLAILRPIGPSNAQRRWRVILEQIAAIEHAEFRHLLKATSKVVMVLISKVAALQRLPSVPCLNSVEAVCTLTFRPAERHRPRP